MTDQDVFSDLAHLIQLTRKRRALESELLQLNQQIAGLESVVKSGVDALPPRPKLRCLDPADALGVSLTEHSLGMWS